MTDLKAEFRALLERGLNQADALQVLADFGDPKAEHYPTSQAARAQYCDDDIEIDDAPLFSVADNGCWVSAWVWVEGQDEEA